jgi:hypothetical protein
MARETQQGRKPMIGTEVSGIDVMTVERIRRDRSPGLTWWIYGVALFLGSSVISASAEDALYESMTEGGTIEMTNVPTEDRFRPAGHNIRRIHPRVSVHEVERAVARYAWQYQLHPALLLAVIKAESDFNPTVISRAGAVGLMQLIPETAIRHGVENLYDTNDNIRGGARHIRYLLDRFNGNLRLAVAAYNAGEHRVERFHAIPPYQETREYVRKVMTYYKSFKGHYRSHTIDVVLLAINHRPLPCCSVSGAICSRLGRTVTCARLNLT